MLTKKSPIFILIFLALPAIFFVACGGSTAVPTPPPATLTLGEVVYSKNCAPCHLLTPNDVKVGPSLYGIADHAGTRVEGQDARTYIQTSILRPDEYLVENFDNLMPSTLAKNLTGEEMDAVIDYLMTLKVEE